MKVVHYKPERKHHVGYSAQLLVGKYCMHDTCRQTEKMNINKLLLLRCRRFRDENPRRINRQTSVGIIHRVAPTSTSTHVKSYNGVSRWKIFTISSHLPSSEGIIYSVPFENDQVDVGRSAALTTVESEKPSRTAPLVIGTCYSVNS